MSESFNYSFSAAEQEEIENIRKKYVEDKKPVALDKIEQLRRLDASVTNKATVWSLCVGIISALVMGTGMSLIMTDLGKMIGISNILLPGLALGFLGMFGIIFAYPLYRKILKKEREKAKPLVLKLTDELASK